MSWVDRENVQESALSCVLSGKRPISAPTLLRVERVLRGVRSPAAKLRIEGVSEPCEFSHTGAVAAVPAQRDSTAPRADAEQPSPPAARAHGPGPARPPLATTTCAHTEIT